MGYGARSAALRQYGTDAREVSPHRRIELALAGVLQRLAAARAALGAGNVPERGRVLGEVLTILGGLRTALDLGAGGSIAAGLDQLYAYCVARVLHANLHADAAAITEVAGLIAEVKGAWDAIPDTLRAAA